MPPMLSSISGDTKQLKAVVLVYENEIYFLNKKSELEKWLHRVKVGETLLSTHDMPVADIDWEIYHK